MVAYDIATGDQRWKWNGDSPAYASPVLLTANSTNLIIAETERQIVAVTAADGKLVWEAPFAVQPRSYNAATPIVDGQTLIYGGGERGTRAVKIEKDGDRFVAKELWNNKETSVQFNTPVLRDGFLFGLSQRNEFFCMNAWDGKTLWTAPAGQTASGGGGRLSGGMGGGYGSIVNAGLVLVALTPSAQLIFFQPSHEAYPEVARYKVANTPTYAYPVVAGNRIFIKDLDSVALWTL
jgi:outer membrane protein assembly factor BamB